MNKVHNTGIDTKAKHFDEFAELIGNQFKHGGDKYKLSDRSDKELTDLICELSPGKTGFDWIFQTQLKYMGRFMNFNREKDLLKIAAYCYIAWLKSGFHLKDQHDEDVSKDGREELKKLSLPSIESYYTETPEVEEEFQDIPIPNSMTWQKRRDEINKRLDANKVKQERLKNGTE